MKVLEHNYQFVVIGGGFAGMCAAITAARSGINTALVQDRPVLGGNAGKEIRVTPVGADNCNFLYSRETGLIEEVMLKNLYENPGYSYEGFDIVMNSIVKAEPALKCYFNTSVLEVEVEKSSNSIKSVKGYTAGSETWHTFRAPFFADCTGDGTIGALAGAPYRIGIEARSEFNEWMCEDHKQDCCMGGSVQFHTINKGIPSPFKKPEWVKYDLNEDDFGPYRPVIKDFYRNNGGYWWIELGGDMDTIHDTSLIFEETRDIVYATWDYLKNKSPLREELETYELNWVSPVLGKRESRRLEGDYILSMGDIESQKKFPDAVAFGGWGFDHHPPGGFNDKVKSSYHVYHAGPYNIPLRCLYSRHNVNLFMAGRNISATHYGLSSTRVMFTTAQLGEAVGMAAVHCIREKQTPPGLLSNDLIKKVQNDLIKNDHNIHDWPMILADDIAPEAKITASSVLPSPDVLESDNTELLNDDKMFLFPVVTRQLKKIELYIDVTENSVLQGELYYGPESNSTFPTGLIWAGEVPVEKGKNQWVEIPVNCDIDRPGWHFLVIKKNAGIALHSGKANVGTCKYKIRHEDPIRPDPNSKWHTGKEALYADGSFHNEVYCFQLHPPQPVYKPENIANEYSRPTNVPNLWASRDSDFSEPEWINLSWDSPRSVTRIDLIFDSMLDFHFAQKWGGYKNNVLPSIVKDYCLWAIDFNGNEILVIKIQNNYQRLRKHSCQLENLKSVRLEVLDTNGLNRAHIYSIRVFEN